MSDTFGIRSLLAIGRESITVVETLAGIDGFLRYQQIE